MANGWGGRRPGSGAKRRKSDAQMEITGSPRRRRSSEPAGRVLHHPSAASPKAPELPKVDETDCPNELDVEGRKVWIELAPHAYAAGTLTPATRYAFTLLCQNIVMERAMRQAPLAIGTANHRGIIQRIDAELLAFNIRPCGKPMADGGVGTHVKPVNPLDRFRLKASGS